MPKPKITDTVYKLAEPIADKFNCEVVDVEFKKEGSDWFLRVFIDKQGGITLDDCEDVSRELSKELDRVDPIQQSYYLELSSPGINRTLKRTKDFINSIGMKIEIKLYKAINGKKSFVGILQDFKEDIAILEISKDDIMEFSINNISVAKLVEEF